MSDQTSTKGGRPKNVNERMLQDAITGLREELSGEVIGDAAPVSRGTFFLHLMTGLCIHRGEAAWNPQFLDTIRNNADDFYDAYTQIVRSEHEVQSTTRQMLEEAQQRIRAVEQEREILMARTRELETERAALEGSMATEESPA